MHGIDENGYRRLASIYSEPTDEQGGWDDPAYDNTYYRLWINPKERFFAIAAQPKGIYLEDVQTFINKYDALDAWARIREKAAEMAWSQNIQPESTTPD